MKDWANRVLTLLNEQSGQGKTASGLAKACGAAPNSITQWFGQVKSKKPTEMIRADHALATARYLGTTVEWIFTGRGAREASQSVELDKETLAQAFVAADKALRSVGLTYDAAQVPDMLVYAYKTRSQLEPGRNPGVMAAFDLMVKQQLEGGMGRGAETGGSTDSEHSSEAAQASSDRKKNRSR